MSQPPPKRRTKRRWPKVLLSVFALLLLGGVVLVAQGWRSFGSAPEGARLERVQGSAQWNGDAFENPQPLYNDAWGMLAGMFSRQQPAEPEAPVAVETITDGRFDGPVPDGLRITWFGHSSVIIEVDGHRFLADPVWGERTSPIPWLGPKRFYAPPLALEALPEVDAVLISHDHYDHLDRPTIEALAPRGMTFVVPLGVGAHLEGWGVSPEQLIELDWWDTHRFGDVELTMTPSRHASGRQVFDQNRTLWASYALVGPEHRVFFSGDTGLFPGLREIGERLGPFDLTMFEVGAYDPAWPDWHLGPEQAVQAHRLVRGRHLLPIHWGLFNLAYHGWTEPIERTLAAAQAQNVSVLAPPPGRTLQLASEVPETERWWPDAPWRTEEQQRIHATACEQCWEPVEAPE